MNGLQDQLESLSAQHVEGIVISHPADRSNGAAAESLVSIVDLRTARTRYRGRHMLSAAAALVLVIGASLFFISRNDDGSATTYLATEEPLTGPDGEDLGNVEDAVFTTPGTWRPIADSPLAPAQAHMAVWTGTEAIVIGLELIDGSDELESRLVAYDVGRDQWRRLADPPSALTSGSPMPPMQWTGTEVLTATPQGAVYAYDPEADRWISKAGADESMGLAGGDTLVAVATRGVLARASTGWWWYENSTDQWESVPAPSNDIEYSSSVNTLDQNRIVATQIESATITSAVFDIATGSWRNGPPVEDTPIYLRNFDPPACGANDGLLVCFTERAGKLNGLVIDPLLGRVGTFNLGSHSNTISTQGLPWMTHAWKLLVPRSSTWEDLPPISGSRVDGFSAAVWTGSEILFFGGSESASGEPLRTTAAYTPLQLPGG